jgi:hypothetical protein
MKTSFCIPVTYRHFNYLKELLNTIKDYVEKPDEITISISEVDTEEKLNEIQYFFNSLKENLKIDINYKHFISKQNSGQNRNTCIELASNDLIIINDADDLPHVERIKIIKNIFENNDIIHLTHGYMQLLSPELNYSIKQFDYKLKQYELNYVKKRNFYIVENANVPIHEGAVSFLKSKINKIIKYKENKNNYIIWEDQDFNIEVLEKYNKSFHLDVPLYLYRVGSNNLAGL